MKNNTLMFIKRNSLVIIASISSMIIIFTAITKRVSSVNKGNYDVITAWNDSSEVVFDAGTMDIYNNMFMEVIDSPGVYVYDCIVADSTLSASYLYSKIPYQIPADDNFHDVIVGNKKVYLKFKQVRK